MERIESIKSIRKSQNRKNSLFLLNHHVHLVEVIKKLKDKKVNYYYPLIIIYYKNLKSEDSFVLLFFINNFVLFLINVIFSHIFFSIWRKEKIVGSVRKLFSFYFLYFLFLLLPNNRNLHFLLHFSSPIFHCNQT